MEQAFEVFLGRLYEMLNEAIRVLKENLKRGSMPVSLFHKSHISYIRN